MKLDNRGWGYRDMIIYSCILLFCLLLSVYFVNSLYNDLEKSAERQKINSSSSDVVEVPKKEDKDDIKIDYSYYFDLEDKLKEATTKYIKNENVDLSNGLVTINSSILVDKGYLNDFYDQYGVRCGGYSNVLIEENSEYSVQSYILCNDYSTAGY